MSANWSAPYARNCLLLPGRVHVEAEVTDEECATIAFIASTSDSCLLLLLLLLLLLTHQKERLPVAD
jgi:hypothetical protein